MSGTVKRLLVLLAWAMLGGCTMTYDGTVDAGSPPETGNSEDAGTWLAMGDGGADMGDPGAGPAPDGASGGAEPEEDGAGAGDADPAASRSSGGNPRTYLRVGNVNAARDPGAAEARYLLRFFNEHRVRIVGLQETGQRMRDRVRARHPNWTFSYVKHIWKDYTSRGIGQLNYNQHWRIVDRHTFRVPYSDPSSWRETGWLPVQVVLYKNRETGGAVAVINQHQPLPWNDGAPRARARMNARTRYALDRLRAVGIPTVVVGDANEHHWGADLNAGGVRRVKLALKHSVDYIFVSRNVSIGGARSFRVPRNVSDHGAIMTAWLNFPTVRRNTLPF